MKKIIFMTLVLVTALCLCACGAKAPAPTDTTTEPPRKAAASGITPVSSIVAADEDAVYFLYMENSRSHKGSMPYHVMRYESRPDAKPEVLCDEVSALIQLDSGEWVAGRNVGEVAKYDREGRAKIRYFLLLGCEGDRVYYLEMPQNIDGGRDAWDETDFAALAGDYSSGVLRWTAKDGKTTGEIGEIPVEFAAQLIMYSDFCYWYGGEIWAWDRVLNPETGEIRNYGIRDLVNTEFDTQGQSEIIQAALFKVLDRDEGGLTYTYVHSNGELRVCRSQEGKEVILYTKDLSDRSQEDQTAFLHRMQYDKEGRMVYLLENRQLIRVSLDSGVEESVVGCSYELGESHGEPKAEYWEYFRPYALSGKYIYAFDQEILQIIHKDTLEIKRQPLKNYPWAGLAPNISGLPGGGCALWQYMYNPNIGPFIGKIILPIYHVSQYLGDGNFMDTGILP